MTHDNNLARVSTVPMYISLEPGHSLINVPNVLGRSHVARGLISGLNQTPGMKHNKKTKHTDCKQDHPVFFKIHTEHEEQPQTTIPYNKLTNGPAGNRTELVVTGSDHITPLGHLSANATCSNLVA